MTYKQRPFLLRLLNVLIHDPSRHRARKRAKIQKHRQRTDKRQSGKRKPEKTAP